MTGTAPGGDALIIEIIELLTRMTILNCNHGKFYLDCILLIFKLSGGGN